MRKTYPDVKVLITHVVPGNSHRKVCGKAWDASDEDIKRKASLEVFGWPYAPLGTRELTRCKDGSFSVIVHTD